MNHKILVAFLFLAALAVVSQAYYVQKGNKHSCAQAGLNNEYSSTCSHCPANCRNMYMKNRRKDVCGTPETDCCKCKEGYVFRNGASGDCILPTECPETIIRLSY
ncbi:hypothetical protein BLOT_015848 [Blomia tropicalis]|nr:hypothetical protein BLOT_016689 [Blomia tropicalis]KAI2796294.1 hypothetical protein BLOT_015848 [Blomia tropicalis]